jgi:CubicO group peptidase (beta-lactamase class C family)
VTLGACTDDDEPTGSQTAPTTQPVECDATTHEALGAWEAAGFSGVVTITDGDGEPVCEWGYGFADEAAGRQNTADTVFALGSVSKAVTAAAVLDLVDHGDLALDDRAGDRLPALTGPAADARIDHLLLHTSGLSGSHGADHEPLTRDEAIAAISELELAEEPGATFLYSNAGYTLLALLVEEAAGVDYRESIVTEILTLPDGEIAGGFWDGEPAPNGPRAVGYHDDGETGALGDFTGPHWALTGNGDVAMTMPQLAAWTRALFTGELLSPSTADLLTTLRFDNGDGTEEAPGWVVLESETFGEPVFASAGGGGDVGHDVVVAWLPDTQRVVTIASNRAEITAEDLLQALAPALVAGDPLPHPPTVDETVDPAALDALVGTYAVDGASSFEVRATDSGLEITAVGGDAMGTLFAPPAGTDPEAVAAHEAAVLDLFEGETEAGRDELDALAQDLGSIEDVTLTGSAFIDGEIRTYVELTAAGTVTPGWYALDDGGGVAAVEIAVSPPTLVVLPVGDDRFRPDDPAGTGPDVSVRFRDGTMSVVGPAGSVEATRS